MSQRLSNDGLRHGFEPLHVGMMSMGWSAGCRFAKVSKELSLLVVCLAF